MGESRYLPIFPTSCSGGTIASNVLFRRRQSAAKEPVNDADCISSSANPYR